MRLEEAFARAFGRKPETIASAPGRVNLLGEHTDYNEGLVLPIATPQRTHVALACTEAEDCFLSAQLASAPAPGVTRFRAYVDACLQVLRDRGTKLPAHLIYVTSDVPMGAGLSSSAALEIAVLRALRERHQLRLDDRELAQLGQQAENQYVGVRSGILDQMASSFATCEAMLRLDTRSLQTELLPLPSPAGVLVLDSGVRRNLSESAYNTRRAECEQAAHLLGVASLRDCQDLQRIAQLPPPLDRRARHVITENARVASVGAGTDAPTLGRLMRDSQASLKGDFEVSIAALDALVALLQAHAEVYGAKLTGAGFGGACVALVRKGQQELIADEVLRGYAQQGRQGTRLL